MDKNGCIQQYLEEDIKVSFSGDGQELGCLLIKGAIKMKTDRSNDQKPRTQSELLEGTRPAHDARLIRDIMNAGTDNAGTDASSSSTRPIKSPKPHIVITKQSTNHRNKPISTNGASTWDSSS